MINGTSDFGVELDSLSDLVSFGAAPAYLVYKFGLEGMWGIGGVALSALLMVGSGLRLARFNISMIGYSKESFSGLPTPAQALTIAGFVLWMQNEQFFGLDVMPPVLSVLTVVLALLMVSRVNYDALPKPTLDLIRRHPFQVALYALALFCVLVFQTKAFFSGHVVVYSARNSTLPDLLLPSVDSLIFFNQPLCLLWHIPQR